MKRGASSTDFLSPLFVDFRLSSWSATWRAAISIFSNWAVIYAQCVSVCLCVCSVSHQRQPVSLTHSVSQWSPQPPQPFLYDGIDKKSTADGRWLTEQFSLAGPLSKAHTRRHTDTYWQTLTWGADTADGEMVEATKRQSQSHLWALPLKSTESSHQTPTKQSSNIQPLSTLG